MCEARCIFSKIWAVYKTACLLPLYLRNRQTQDAAIAFQKLQAIDDISLK